MRVLRYAGVGDVLVEERDVPELGDGEVLIRVDACGICATDVKTVLKGHARIEVGRVLGHEVVGEVVRSLAEGWAVGEAVIVAPYVPCLECEWCRLGQYTVCSNLFRDRMDPGGFSEYVRISRPVVERGLFRIPAGMEPETAVFGEPLACSLHGLRNLGGGEGDSVLIVGDGTMGILQAGLAGVLGFAPVMVAGATKSRLEFARKVTEHVMNVTEPGFSEAVLELTRGIGPDHVMVSVPLEEPLQTAIGLVRKGGTVNLFAGFPKGSTPQVDVNRIHYQELKVTGSFGFAPEDFRDGLELAVSGGLPLAEMITDRVSLSEVGEAIRRAGSWSGLKTVVHPHGVP